MAPSTVCLDEISALQKSTFDLQKKEVVSPLISDRMITSNVAQLLDNLFLFYLKSFILLVCFRSGPRGQRDDCVETEMWKHSNSEVDLSRPWEEELDRKSLGDMTLGVNPEFRMTSA